MRHIRPHWINSNEVTGEFFPSDYTVFDSIKELAHVSRFWDALVTHALTIDKASASFAEGAPQTVQTDPEHAAWIQNQDELAADAHFYLTRASLLSLLAGFVEFCLLESFKLTFGSYPNNQRPNLVQDVIRPLESKIGPIKPPKLFEQTMIESRDTVRNALQHGRWMNLKDASEQIDLHDAFFCVASYAQVLESALLNFKATKHSNQSQ